MVKPSFPFPPVPDWVLSAASTLAPPPWLQAELLQKLVLLLNHVLQSEPEAMARLARHQGQVFSVEGSGLGRSLRLSLTATPAGLLDLATSEAMPDLRLQVADEHPAVLLQHLVSGQKPSVRIEGDVQLAADLNWLVDHVRWDIEEDLARLLGDERAHGLVQLSRPWVLALQGFVRSALGATPNRNTAP